MTVIRWAHKWTQGEWHHETAYIDLRLVSFHLTWAPYEEWSFNVATRWFGVKLWW